MKHHITSIILALCWLTPLTASARLHVVATLPDLAAIASEVGGERVDVEALAPPTVDPHFVDPRPNLIVALNRADALIENGLELEHAWLEPLVLQARNARIAAGAPGRFVAAEHAKLIGGKSAKADRAEGDVHPGGNPHFYSDPTSAISIANGLRDHLTRLDPEGAATYRANAKRFTAELWALVKAEAVRFARLPREKRRVVSYHRSLGYTFRWLNLEEVATVEPRPGIPPNPRHVARVLGVMRERGARVIVQEEYYPTKTSETLARMAEGAVVTLPGGTRFDDGQTYVERTREVARRLYEALAR